MSGYLEYLPACFGDDLVAGLGSLEGFLRACEAVLSGGVRLDRQRRVLESASGSLIVEPLGAERVLTGPWPQRGTRGFKVLSFETGSLLRSFDTPPYPYWIKGIDCHRILVWSSGNAEVWDVDTGRRLQTLLGFDTYQGRFWVVDQSRLVNAKPAESAVGPRRVTGTTLELELWDVGTGTKLRTMSGHTDEVTAFALLDDLRGVSASLDGTLRVWDLESGSTTRVLQGHTAGVTAVLALDASRVASGSSDRTLRIWDARKGELLHTSELLPIQISRLRRLSPHRLAASGTKVEGDASVVIFDSLARPLRRFCDGGEIAPLIEVLDEDRLLVGLRSLEVWNPDTETRAETLVEAPTGMSHAQMVPWVLDPGRILCLAATVEERTRVYTCQLLALESTSHVGIEEEVERLPVLLDPGPHLPSAERTPAELLPWLASWLGATLDPRWPEEARRRLLAEIVPLYRLRGTPAGIARMVRIYTGMEPAIVPDPARPHCFKVTIHSHQREPEEVRRLQAEVRRILDREKPAHTWYDLDFEVPTMQIGVHSTVGLDTLLGEETN